MKFIRIFKSGGADYDARQHKVAEWKCDVCKHVHWKDHVDENLIDKAAEVKCPRCGSYSVADRIHALKLRKTDLVNRKIDTEKQITDTEKEIEAICAELEKNGSVTGVLTSI